MPPCQATVDEHNSCYSIFRTAEGKKFFIGSRAATPEVVQFLKTLKNGQTYEFPGAFLDYAADKDKPNRGAPPAGSPPSARLQAVRFVPDPNPKARQPIGSSSWSALGPFDEKTWAGRKVPVS